eukprot:jgi/Chlat1/8268/Chrsp78S07728
MAAAVCKVAVVGSLPRACPQPSACTHSSWLSPARPAVHASKLRLQVLRAVRSQRTSRKSACGRRLITRCVASPPRKQPSKDINPDNHNDGREAAYIIKDSQDDDQAAVISETDLSDAYTAVDRLLDAVAIEQAEDVSNRDWRVRERKRRLRHLCVLLLATGGIVGIGLMLCNGQSTYTHSALVAGWWSGALAGITVGTHVREQRIKVVPKNIVITGSTRGLGKALAREFLRRGDNVVIASRSASAVRDTVGGLQAEQQEWRTFGEAECPTVIGQACDVADGEQVQKLADFAVEKFGSIDIWINNAGTNPGAKPLLEYSDKELEQVVNTNLLGSLICTRTAVKVMQQQPDGGHVFNMEGAGSGGQATGRFAAYGATKCALRQLQQSLLAETEGTKVGVHLASPGMVLTELLLRGATTLEKQLFNIVCEQPETVARVLVPHIRSVEGTGSAIRYLTPPRILGALASAWLRRGRWFDDEGRAVYAAEAERLAEWGRRVQHCPIAASEGVLPPLAWAAMVSSTICCAYIMLTLQGSVPPV